jgi:hypothetical protein
MALTCQYCGRAAGYRPNSRHLYQGRDYGPVWECLGQCEAYVGCHPDGEPLGTLANRQLRIDRRRVHDVFDPLWRDIHLAYPGIPVRVGHVRHIMRVRAYEWLAEQLGMQFEDCHIAKFNRDRCAIAITAIQKQQPTALTIRAWAKARDAV